MINLTDFHQALDQARGYPLNGQQRQAVDFGTGPLWIIAGPGSGKSEVLATRALKLICVDRVEPRSILLTTFTKKAARNLEDRLAAYLLALQRAQPARGSLDISDMRVGTLHALCNDILQEFRFPGYQNVRLLEDLEQHLFVYKHTAIVDHTDLAFWTKFDYAVTRWSPNGGYPPNKWARAKAAVILFNHIAEDLVDLARMRAAGGHWATLADLYVDYEATLRDRYRCDYAHLQQRFWEFLQVPMGQGFLNGSPDKNPPLTHVLVDEYQDTNPIQERIYLALAQQAPHNLTVVGDDDQALYRFRGGTVACMVNFDQACQVTWGVAPQQVPLTDNYRSHDEVVQFFNGYIRSFTEMNQPGVRAPNKQDMVPQAGRPAAHPGVVWISPRRAGDLGHAVADFIQQDLMGAGVISDWSQCVILLRSVQDTPRNAGPYIQALADRGIPVYNPRSRSFLDSEEVQCLLGVLIRLLDPAQSYMSAATPNGQPPFWQASIAGWCDALDQVLTGNAHDTTALDDYIHRSLAALAQEYQRHAGRFLGVTLTEILYRVLALEPFRTWRQDPNRNLRLSKVTRLFESYHSFNLDTLRAEPDGSQVAQNFLGQLYWMFFGYLIASGVDDDEDDEVIVPPGYLPMMTIHQAKGLEFPFVIVGHLGSSGRIGASQALEVELAPFRQDLYPRAARTPDLLALEDDIRLLYVAYSRAEYALVLAGTQAQVKSHVAAPGRDYTGFRRTVRTI
ncbi:ATP-dependent helicase [uncultured Thiohalocapsa sp.]|uniref:UvrD-helicase domain-containing protein n=1 Tax=uncultured Thiohalocapsa sp. TaxID=768990 RepID=UPI0025F2736C|nr:ATP-dependent helicase [uncultured Thiohalocapsa sp.]